ncbi:uncharacterized protein LOC121767055 [Salvia splendens]|uniref:uncharacterized protein LOC121767055 n=1 Tax=Salvia splendens TaxID=180675 RepID=UPI001C25A1A6|nr:uncharacterized protein LOC121767055 [Salvia splendens]
MALVLHDGTADAQIIDEARRTKGVRNGAARNGSSPMEITGDGDRRPMIKVPMKKARFLVWNAQGVANARTKRHLRYLIREHKILFAAVIEPQRTPPALGRNFQCLRFAASSESGHIWILAREDWTVEVVDDSRQALHVKTRQVLWEKLGDISLAVEGRPWLVGGDFNMFLTNEERQGSDTDRHRDMMEFADAIAECQLIDPGFDGPIFTWHRGRLWERLDRILIGEHWTSIFATTRVTHMAKFSSDHAPLLVRCQFSVQTARPAFRFQNIEVFGNIIQNLKDTELVVLEAQTLYDSDLIPAHRAEFSRVSAELIVTPDLSLIHTLPDSANQEALCSLPQEKEVRDAVFGISGDSVSGPDGLTSLFFQSCLDIVGRDVIAAVGDFFSGAFMPRSFTATMIVLIRKKPNPSGFIKGCLLSDNALLVQELIHDLGQELLSIGRSPNLALKLDMAKAYDRVQWSFLLKRGGGEVGWMPGSLIAVSGQLVNNGKAHFYLANEHMEFADIVEKVGGFQRGVMAFTYLGVPIFRGVRRANHLLPLRQRLMNRIHSWSHR